MTVNINLVVCPKLQHDIRTPKMSQDKAQFAGNGCSIAENCNAGLGPFGGSPRASRETAICCVVILVKDMPFPADDALHMAVSRLADFVLQFRAHHSYYVQYSPQI